jgi:hypothetical protein
LHVTSDNSKPVLMAVLWIFDGGHNIRRRQQQFQPGVDGVLGVDL